MALHLSNHNPPPAGNPISNTNQVGSPVYNGRYLWDTPFLYCTLHRSFRNGHIWHPLVHLWVWVEQLIVQVIHQTKFKRSWCMNVCLSFVAFQDFFVVHRAGITFTFLLYSIGTKKQPVMWQLKKWHIRACNAVIFDYNECITKTRVWGRTDSKPSSLTELWNNICNFL